MAITRTKVFPVQGQSPIVLHNVPQSIELVGDITGDKGTNEVWEDTKRIEDFEVKVTTLDEYSTGVPHKVVKRVDTLDTTSKTWMEGTQETYEAQEEEFTLSYKGHERDFEVKIDSEESKAFIKYRWSRNDAHDLTVEKDITITERPTPSEGGGEGEDPTPSNVCPPIEKAVGYYTMYGGASYDRTIIVYIFEVERPSEELLDSYGYYAVFPKNFSEDYQWGCDLDSGETVKLHSDYTGKPLKDDSLYYSLSYWEDIGKFGDESGTFLDVENDELYVYKVDEETGDPVVPFVGEPLIFKSAESEEGGGTPTVEYIRFEAMDPNTGDSQYIYALELTPPSEAYKFDDMQSVFGGIYYLIISSDTIGTPKFVLSGSMMRHMFPNESIPSAIKDDVYYALGYEDNWATLTQYFYYSSRIGGNVNPDPQLPIEVGPEAESGEGGGDDPIAVLLGGEMFDWTFWAIKKEYVGEDEEGNHYILAGVRDEHTPSSDPYFTRMCFGCEGVTEGCYDEAPSEFLTFLSEHPDYEGFCCNSTYLYIFDPTTRECLGFFGERWEFEPVDVDLEFNNPLIAISYNPSSDTSFVIAKSEYKGTGAYDSVSDFLISSRPEGEEAHKAHSAGCTDCTAYQDFHLCPYSKSAEFNSIIWSMPEGYDGACTPGKPVTLYDYNTGEEIATSTPIYTEGSGDEDDGDAWGYPLVDGKDVGMHYRISVPDELKGKELSIRTSVPNSDTPVSTGAELKNSVYLTLAEDDEYYASFHAVTAFGKPSEWWFACRDEDTWVMVDTDYKVEVPSDEPRMSTTEVTSVTFDKSKMITPSGTDVPIMVVPFPYKQGYPAMMLEGFFFKETLESVKAEDYDNVVIGIPCSTLPNFSELGLSTADCMLYYGLEPTDGSKFHYLFANMETWKFGYFDDNGDFVEVEINL